MTNKQRQTVNQNRRMDAANKQTPLPPAEQQKRAAERATDYRWRYPRPPVYATKIGSYEPEKKVE